MQTLNDRLSAAKRVIEAQTAAKPLIGIILGSGLGPMAAEIADASRISTLAIPAFPRSTVDGHAGELLLGRWEGRSVALLSGRVHIYEGYAASDVGYSVRLLHALGCRYLIVTNAAGALNPDYRPGDVMIIEDHISLPGLTGSSPLVGFPPNGGLRRFVDLTDAYSPELRILAEAAAIPDRSLLRRGVYVMVGGPNFETPAEVRFLRMIGADAVGMSTVPEVTVARQLEMPVLGVSVISNMAAGLPGALLAHDDVLATVASAVPLVSQLIRAVLNGLPR